MPWMFWGARGFGVPGSGASRLRFAATATPPSLPAMIPLVPGVTVPSKGLVPPLTQLTSPVRRCGASLGPGCRRSLPPSDPAVLEKLTNCPDCLTSNDGPAGGGCAGAVAGSGGPLIVGAGAPRHGFGAVA